MTGIRHSDYTHQLTDGWLEESQESRVTRIQDFLNLAKEYDHIVVKDAFDNGHVVVAVEEGIPARTRGLFLLDLEQKLKKSIDIGLTLWLEPIGDKSKLRQLRGVDVKN